MTDKREAFFCPSAWIGNEHAYRNFLRDNVKGGIGCIVELGVDYGYSLFRFASDFEKALVIGVDNFSYGDGVAPKAHLNAHLHLFPNIRVLEMSTEEAIKLWRRPDMYCDIDLLHIDADHQYASVKRDFELWSPCVRPGGCVMFHDILAFKDDVGRFFDELKGGKVVSDDGAGLGAWIKDE